MLAPAVGTATLYWTQSGGIRRWDLVWGDVGTELGEITIEADFPDDSLSWPAARTSCLWFRVAGTSEAVIDCSSDGGGAPVHAVVSAMDRSPLAVESERRFGEKTGQCYRLEADVTLCNDEVAGLPIYVGVASSNGVDSIQALAFYDGTLHDIPHPTSLLQLSGLTVSLSELKLPFELGPPSSN